MMYQTTLLQLTGLVLSLGTGLFFSDVSRGEELTFERDIRPILRAHCLDCHGAVEELKGGLDLRQVRLMQKGGDSGTALVAGDAHTSLLLERIRSKEMPPGEIKVTDKELEILTRWVTEGAKTARPEPETIPPGLGITPEERAFWSFQPIKRVINRDAFEIRLIISCWLKCRKGCRLRMMRIAKL